MAGWSVASWLKRLYARGKSRSARKAQDRARWRRAFMEPLEERLPLASYIVMTSGDSNVNMAPFPGSGTTADPFQVPTLREAIIAANKTPGTADTITFAPSLNGAPISLTIGNVGGDDNAAMTGDLDVTDNLTIQGNGIAADGFPNITIQGGTSEATSVDKVFAINPNRNTAVSFTLQAISVRFGKNSQQGSLPASSGGGLDWQGLGTSNLTISDCVFGNNQTMFGNGGGINIDGLSATGNVMITNTAIINNTSDGTGGGINVLGDHLAVVLSGSTISGNSTLKQNGANEAGGGGINVGLSQQGSVLIKSSAISGNAAKGFGGGVRIVGDQTVDISSTAIVGNTSQGDGTNPSGAGGLLNQNSQASTTTLTSVLIAGNSALDGVAGNDPVGGGVVNANLSQLIVRNSTISGNQTAGSGGGLATFGGPTNLVNVTISNNRADKDDNGTGAGGGIRSFGPAPSLANTLDAGNFRGSGTLADDVNGPVTTTTSLIGTITGLDVLQDNGGQTVGASVGPTGFVKVLQTHALFTGSPALDAGTNASIAGLPNDQRGVNFARVLDSADTDLTAVVDIGAFEAHPSIEDIVDQVMGEDSTLSIIFNVGDDNPGVTPPIQIVAATSDNPTLVTFDPTSVTTPTTGSRSLAISPNQNQTGTAIITVTVTTANGQNAKDTFLLTVNPVNDAPENKVPPVVQNTDEDTALVFSTANNNSILITDVDAGNGLMLVSLSVNHGTLSLSSANGVTISSGANNSAAMTIMGTLSNVNAALAGMSYQPAADYSGPDTLTIVSNDQGNSGSGGAMSDTDSVAINVNPVGDKPSVTNSVTYANTQSASGLVITPNPVDGSTVTNFKITGITDGNLFKNDGITQINNGDFITVAEGNAGLKFTPNANFVGTGHFTVQASTTNTNVGLSVDNTKADIVVIRPTITVAATTGTAGEGSGSNLVYAFTRTDDPSQPLTVAFNVGGSAIFTTDYDIVAGGADASIISGSGLVTFAGGASTAIVNLGPIDENLVESSEFVTFDLALGAQYQVGSPKTATGTITDNDTATWSLTGSANVTEGAAASYTPALAGTLQQNETATIDLSISSPSGTSGAVAADFTNDFLTDVDTAIAAYNAAGPGTLSRNGNTLTFTATGSNVALGTFTISLSTFNDTLVEGTESYTVSLANPGSTTGANVTGTGIQTTTITDNDTATISIAKVSDGAETNSPTPGKFRVTQSAISSTDTVINFTLSGTATPGAGNDFTATASPVTIPAGQTFVDIDITVLNDAIVEGTETVTATLTSLGAHDPDITLSAATTDSLDITDDDTATISIAKVTDGAEPGTNGRFRVTQTLPSSTDTVVNYTIGGTAAAGSDYTALSGTVTIPANQTTADIVVAVQNDAVVEAAETVVTTLSNLGAHDPDVTLDPLAANLTATVNITDNDTATFTINDVTVNESAGTLTFTVSLSNQIDILAQVDVSFADVSTSGGDFTDTTQTVTFPANSTADQTVSVPINDDGIVETSETFTASLILNVATPLTGYSKNLSDTGTGTIQDNDSATVSIAQLVDGAEPATHGTFRVTLTQASSTDTVVNYTIGGTATANSDYTALSGTVTVLANQTTADIDVAPLNDTFIEGTETVIVTLTSLGAHDPDITLDPVAANRTATVNIADDDTATVEFQLATSTAGENAGAHSVIAVLTTAPGNTLVSPAVFSVTTTNGLTTNADYDSGTFPKTITFAAGSGNSTPRTVNITPQPDNFVEGDEDVMLTLTAVGGAAAVGAQATHLVTIQDADSATISIVAGQTVAEDGGSQPINVRLNMAAGLRLERPLGVEMSASPAAGTEAVDAGFGFLGGFTFLPTDTPGTVHSISFTPTPDTFVEGNENAVLTPTGNALNGQVTYTAGNVSILDADAASVSFANASQSIGEEAAPLTVTVQLSISGINTLEDQAQFNVSVSSLGGTTAGDFDAASFPKLIVFAANSGDGSTQTVTLDPASDAASEGNESLTLGLAKLSGASTVTVTSVGNFTEAVTIVDDDIDLKLTDVGSMDPVVPGSGPGNLTYTLTISNIGKTAATAVTVNEVLALPAGVTIVSITPSSGTTYVPPNAANGKWTIGSLAVGGTSNLTVVITVGAGATPGSTITNNAAISAATETLVNTADDAFAEVTTVASNTLDFGDAPNSYGTLLANNGARHHIGPLFLGAGIDPELDGKPNTTASGDDGTGSDDEDGVTLPSFLVPGVEASIKVVASAAGKLDAWFDFNRNGVFDAVDKVFASLAIGAGASTLTFAVPANAVTGATFARFRLSSAGGLAAVGEAADGEVEDYAIKVMATAPNSAVLIDDPMTPGKKVLIISGTSKNDKVQLTLKKGNVLMCKNGCKMNSFSLASVGRIVLLGKGGKDTLTMPNSLLIPMDLIGQWKVNKTK